jgi:uncharacterized protein (TIGR02757 family)|nr:MAG TPA: Protein of unknown function (DUF2400) [Caudoviricetes sp.]
MAYTLNENLKRWAEQYETAEFVKNDPVQIPRRYDSRVNIEISAFVTAWIAWGNRKQIIKKADFIDREIFHGAPYHYIVGTDTQGAAPEWRQYKDSPESFYRTFTFADFHDLCARLYDVYTSAESMEAAIKKTHETNGETALSTLQSLFGSVNGIPDFETQSACKRLCLFLRWMCRKGSPVDFGLWDVCEPRNLIIPLDTHVHKQAIRLGLTTRRTPDLRTAIEITDRFAEIFPDDPTKGDFALFGYGVNKGTAAGINDITEATKKLTEATKKGTKAQKKVNEAIAAAVPVADLSIADVLKMPLFFDNVKAQLTSLWNDRETARKKAAKVNERLKAHVIDRMHNAGDWEPGKFIVIFATVLDKVATGYSSNEREFIRAVGMTAFNITMQKLIDDEKKRDNSNGNDKQ